MLLLRIVDVFGKVLACAERREQLDLVRMRIRGVLDQLLHTKLKG